jgi:hypothetical protein
MDAACRLLDDLAGSQDIAFLSFEHIKGLPATAAILGADPPTQIAIIRECIDRISAMKGKMRIYDLRALYHEPGFPWEARLVLNRLLRRKLPWSDDDLAYLANRTADLGTVSIFSLPHLPLLVNLIQKQLTTRPITEEMQRGIVRLRGAIEWKRYRAGEARLCEQLSALADSRGDASEPTARVGRWAESSAPADRPRE